MLLIFSPSGGVPCQPGYFIHLSAIHCGYPIPFIPMVAYYWAPCFFSPSISWQCGKSFPIIFYKGYLF